MLRPVGVMVSSRRAAACSVAVVVVVVLAAGCGSSHGSASTGASAAESSTTTATRTAAAAPSPRTTSASEARVQQADLASLALESGARLRNGRIAKRYTCKGADISPPMEWSPPPASTKEDVLVVRTLQEGSLTTNWIVAGINPKLHSIAAGKLPAGAIVGRNSSGKEAYSLCPTGGKAALIIFGVFALSDPLGVHAGFEPGIIDGKAGTPGVSWGSLNLSFAPGGAHVAG